ncbi:molybdopterin-dependent oxidoreductase [bacterium]|nr:molybdopterin-dependent oxidoreductase [bacterium]
MNDFNSIGKSVKKIDSLALATGNERFVDDFPLTNPLFIAFKYSPHAFARIIKIDSSNASKIAGVAEIMHYGNAKGKLHTTAGQGYPEPSPYDTYIFEDIVRFVGDRVAAVAADSPEIATRAVNAIEVEYEKMDPLFDYEKAMDDDAPRLHFGEEYMPIPTAFIPEKNIAAKAEIKFGDMQKGFESAEFIVDGTFRTQYASHCAIEPHSALAYIDERGRLVIITATQVPFHARRIVSHTLGIPIGAIRVIKPRIGGGFGGKQEVFLEQVVAFTTWKTHRPSKAIFNRSEVFISSRTRHPMRVTIRAGVKNSGKITALEMKALMNTGAYGSHALTVLSNAGSKVLPLFNKIKNIHFEGTSVYSNLPIGGAYRGYGATQGYFAYCQIIDMITRGINQDILEYCKNRTIKIGETSPVFAALGEGKEGVGQYINSCSLTECIDRGAKAIDWYKIRDKRIRVGDKVKGVGLSVSMQGSGIPRVDMASAHMKMNEDGSFNLHMGATDLGTGSDTVLAQIAAEVLSISVEKLIVRSSDTDLTPFDVGAYASSTTYVSGNAVRLCAEKVRDQILQVAGEILKCSAVELYLHHDRVRRFGGDEFVTYSDICTRAFYETNQFQIQASASYFGTESPPPFIAQFAEVEVDIKTGKVDVIKFVSAIDCGQPINPKLAEGQVEGATLNGISYALCEEYIFNSSGKMTNPSFWDYKIYNTRDLPEMVTIIADSYEKTGPFGAKSAGEIAINGPGPAIANAIFDAIGVRMLEMPFTQERVYRRMVEEGVI